VILHVENSAGVHIKISARNVSNLDSFHIHHCSKVWGWFKLLFNVFERSLFFSARLHLFERKYSKTNIVKIRK